MDENKGEIFQNFILYTDFILWITSCNTDSNICTEMYLPKNGNTIIGRFLTGKFLWSDNPII